MNSPDDANFAGAASRRDKRAAAGPADEGESRVQVHRGGDAQKRFGVWLRRIALTIVGAISGALCWAHDPGISTAQGELRSDALVLATGFAPADAQQLLPPGAGPKDTKWTPEEFDAAHDQLLAVARQLWEASSGAAPLTAGEIRVELVAGDNITFHHVFRRGARDEPLTLRAPKIPLLPSGHRQFVIISDERGSAITKKLLSARDITLEIPLASGPSSPGTGFSESEAPASWAFIKLGMEHIWMGFDHLLFLFGLLVVCRSFRSIVGIVTCFTLAHSLTLALATLDIVNLPARLVEPAIAASIIFVGVENLVRRGEEPGRRWALTFVFGLIHGFGFATVLRDLGVAGGVQGVAMPLFTFNLGVELGQIAIAAVVLPIVWQLRKREGFLRVGVPVLSAFVAAAGIYWLLQRTLFA